MRSLIPTKRMLAAAFLALPALILLLAFWVLISWNKLQDGFHEFRSLAGTPGWEVRLGDVPMTPEGLPAPGPDAAWKPLPPDQWVSDAIPATYEGYFGLRIRIPEAIRAEGQSLQLRGFKSVQAFTDARKLYEFNMNPRDFRVNKHLHWGMAELKLEDYGTMLTIRAYHDGHKAVTAGFLVGKASDYYSDMLAHDALRIILCVLFLYCSICAFLLFAVTPREPIYFYFAVLTACAAYGSVIRAPTLQLFADIPLFVYLQDVAIPIGTGGLLGFLARLYPDRMRKLFLGMAWSFWGYAALVFGAAWYREPLYHLLIDKVFPVFASVCMSVVLLLMARSYRDRRDRETRWVFAGIVLLVVFAAVYYVRMNVYSFAEWYGLLPPVLLTYLNDTQLTLGLFLFIMCLGGVLILRFADTMQKIRRYSEELAVKNRQLQEMDRLKDDFLARTSHELRTPLFGMIGIAESLLDPEGLEDAGEQRRRLSLIIAGGRRLTRLVNDILDLSKMRHNDLQLQLRPVDIRQTAGIAAALLQTQASAKGLTIRNRIPEDLPPALADEDRVEQILLNLVGNAVKFTFEGTVDLTAELLPEEKGDAQTGEPGAGTEYGGFRSGGHQEELRGGEGSGSTGAKPPDRRAGAVPPGRRRLLRVAVTDTGLGIPEEDLERIFDRFNQSRFTLEQGIGGSGLGLTVSRQLTQMHGGELTVRSTVGQGSTFAFTLPVWTGGTDVAPADRMPVLSAGVPELDAADRGSVPAAVSGLDSLPKSENVPEGATDRRQTLLLVDDEPVNLEVLSSHLAPAYRIVTCSLAVQALELLESGLKPDLILTDVMMPGLNGYELCRRIRLAYGGEADLPILMLTAKSLPEDLAEGFESGANDYLTKPVSKRELLSRVKLHLKVTELNRSLEEEVRDRTAELEKRNRELQLSIRETMEALEEIVALEERNRIAHEIHDTVGHTLTATIMQLEATKRLLSIDGERALEKLTAAQGLVKNGLDQIRSVVRMLKDDVVRTDLRDSLTTLISETEEITGVRIDYDIGPLPELPPLYRKVVFHAVQEGLTNGLKHGGGTRFQFQLEAAEGALHFTLKNNGSPYTEAPFGFGLSAMRERVEHLGGTLRVEASADWGCELQIRLPVH
ncbi:ATP-binding protein [Gorillibacterium sp. sgz5001074]|uniref:ATP-binding protein n=1 Tax=Gorillibacterium sp. sgz5001074 TaxID=3446695 RepID=UPI003F6766F0